ncbi:hypothetical protein PoB_000662600 [Plakobranchus ocellatus]|uniref:Uncharacterized protein n=1 Tax=Plakobranchus ocellatus TaxID=259542 RepID=A0AAV3XYW1_9GAST|nr:hypothetical protein PoB_000662600 [Plakobranchus ocellatus]
MDDTSIVSYEIVITICYNDDDDDDDDDDASPQQGDIRLSGPPSGQGAGGGARTSNRRVSEDLRMDSLATVPPTPPTTHN